MSMWEPGMRWPHLEPARVPEHGEIGLLDIAAVGDLAVQAQQHFAAATEHSASLGIERVGHIDIFWARRDAVFTRVKP